MSLEMGDCGRYPLLHDNSDGQSQGGWRGSRVSRERRATGARCRASVPLPALTRRAISPSGVGVHSRRHPRWVIWIRDSIMALLEAKSLVRLSRMRVVYGVDGETNEYCYEVQLLPEDGSKGMRKLIMDLPNVHLLAAELEACVAVLKAHITFADGQGHEPEWSDPAADPSPNA